MTPDPLTPSPDKAIYDARRWLDAVIHSGLNTIGREKVVELLARYDAARNPDAPSPDSPTPRTREVHLRNQSSSFDYEHMMKHAENLERENAALVKEREEKNTQYENLLRQRGELRATLAERDRELEAVRFAFNDTQSHNAKSARETIDKYEAELTTLRAQLAETQAKLKRIEDGAHADAADLEKMRDGTKLTRAGLVMALVYARKCLAETQLKLKEAEHDLKRTRESDANHEALWKQGAAERVALEAHIEKLREALESCRVVQLDDVSATYHFDPTLVSDALSSEPDLPLIEEVREALAMVEQDHLFPFTVDHDVLLPKVQQLLTRLNPRK